MEKSKGSTNIMLWEAFEKLGKTNKDPKKVDFIHVRFSGCTTYYFRVSNHLVLGEGDDDVFLGLQCLSVLYNREYFVTFNS